MEFVMKSKEAIVIFRLIEKANDEVVFGLCGDASLPLFRPISNSHKRAHYQLDYELLISRKVFSIQTALEENYIRTL